MEDSIKKTEAAIEAILFSLGDAVPLKELSNVLEIDDKTLEKIITNMMDKYEQEDRGIRLVKLENSYQLCTKNEHYDVLSKIVNMPKRYYYELLVEFVKCFLIGICRLFLYRILHRKKQKKSSN